MNDEVSHAALDSRPPAATVGIMASPAGDAPAMTGTGGATNVRAAFGAGAIEIDPVLIERFGGRAPRYTSYPSADRFHAGFGPADYRDAIAERADRSGTALGLYFHIPFCRRICYYCACNKIGSRHQERSAEYLAALDTEMRLVGGILGSRQAISHLHFGGGTPTFMLDDELESLFGYIDRHFERAADGEYSIEVDPRTVDRQRLRRLRDIGFNRVSLGIQDFDEEVQRAVNRIQPYEETLALMQAVRELGFRSMNVDLIYGLPKQRIDGFERTLDRVIAAAPDRVALYHYAHLPQLFKPQRRIHEEDLPDAETRAELFARAVARFRAAGYVYLGLDHFARYDDELAVAQREGRLHRNFQGYAAHDAGDLLAFGVSAIASVGDVYAQNDKGLPAYYARLAEGELPTVRGLRLDADDRIRRDAIQALMCDFHLDVRALERRHGVAEGYLGDALERLAPMDQAGAIRIDPDGIQVLPRGRLLVRAVAAQFDRYLQQAPAAGTYSKLA
ncbi:MAG: oxygen-independent coproporphyrinogen III oxidase [Pseudomonadota bacterium]|nr:oxygen-independent coproporphyrinogen III oxidase [Pseudomonadota bacterium]